MEALQIDADDVEIAGRASQLGRERVAALAAARDLLHAAEDVDPVKLRERIAQAKEASVDENIILAAETKLENLERQIQAFIRAHRITDSLLPAPTSGSVGVWLVHMFFMGALLLAVGEARSGPDIDEVEQVSCHVPCG